MSEHLLPSATFDQATFVTFACPNCKAVPTLTWINRDGVPYCPCNMARIYSDVARQTIARGDYLGYAAGDARKAAHFGFVARPDLREISTEEVLGV